MVVRPTCSHATGMVAVLVTSFFAFQLNIVDHLSKLQESYDLGQEEQTVPETGNSFDYIIVGGGAAGSVLANRLSQNPENQVLLLEKGGDPNPFTQVPALASTNIISGSQTISHRFRTITQANACGVYQAKCYLATGLGLGGSTNINTLIYTRGSPQIFDEWATITGDIAWNFENVVNFFKKSENYRSFDGSEKSRAFHSSGGEWYVRNTDTQDASPALQYFFNSAKDAGYSFVDINNGEEARTGGYGAFDFNIKDGQRWSTYEAFIRPALQRSNLRVYRYAKATKILFDAQNIATGVSYTRNGVSFQANAKKEVILSSGTFGSAQLLMVSGIGPRKDLESLQIPVIADLPVGKTLVDHVFAPVVFSIKKRLFFYPERDTSMDDIMSYLSSKSGFFANALSGTAYLFTQSSISKKNNGPPDLELVYGGLIATKLPSVEDGKDYFAISPLVVTPKSVGDFKLQSKNIDDTPLINPNFLSDSQDLDVLVEGLRIGVSLAEGSPELQALGVHFDPLPSCADTPFNSTAYWICYAQYMGQSGFHPVGTNRMGVDSTQAVVDSKLRVFGVRNLRVVDASVMPVIPNAHTTAPTVMLAEVGSAFILENI